MRVLARYRFATARQLAAALDVEPDAPVDTAGAIDCPPRSFREGLDDLVRDRVLTTLRPTGTLLEPDPEFAFALTRRGAQVFAYPLHEPRPDGDVIRAPSSRA